MLRSMLLGGVSIIVGVLLIAVWSRRARKEVDAESPNAAPLAYVMFGLVALVVGIVGVAMASIAVGGAGLAFGAIGLIGVTVLDRAGKL